MNLLRFYSKSLLKGADDGVRNAQGRPRDRGVNAAAILSIGNGNEDLSTSDIPSERRGKIPHLGPMKTRSSTYIIV